jgi:glycosyltransferase involved in cell wall biosynthesis
MHLGVLIPEFPAQTHVFFWREALALRGLGAKVTFISTRRPKEDCPHRFAHAAVAETHYLFPPRGRAILDRLAHGQVGAALAYVWSLGRPGRATAKHLVLAACAADLACFARATRIDHLHVHSCRDAAHLAAMARRMGGPPYSLHLHGDIDGYGGHHAEKMAGALFVAAAARPMQRQLIERVGIPESRTVTLIMGVDTDRFRPAAVRPPKSPFHVVTVSRLHLSKGHAHALSAIRRVVDRGIPASYSIVGDGPHRAAIAAEVHRLGLEPHVRFLGSLGETEIADLLAQAHVFVLPSIGGMGEASPVAVMEAMASGLPTVCSRIGGTVDMIANEVDGLLTEPGDEAAIAESLARLHDDPGLWERLSQNARRRAETAFDARVLAQRMLDTIAHYRQNGG